MNDPFLRSYYNQQPSRPARTIPVERTHRKTSPRVVSVPVHFVSSSQQPHVTSPESKHSAAVKIQRVFRGFLVRKSVKKIASIMNEVSEIERRVNDVQVVELIRRDTKERLRVNETLMSLLIKLDSIRGVDSGVRDFRKAVIKKAIALQEKVDSIVASDYQTLDTVKKEPDLPFDCKIKLEGLPDTSGFSDEVADVSGKLEADEDDEVPTADAQTDSTTEIIKEIHEDCNAVKDLGYNAEINPAKDLIEGGNDHSMLETGEAHMAVEKRDENCNAVKDVGECMEIKFNPTKDLIEGGNDHSMLESGEADMAVEKGDENCNAVKDVGECMEESAETSPTESLIEDGKDDSMLERAEAGMEVEKDDSRGREDSKRNREVLEKLIEDNEKMMSMMAQIFEGNEMLTRMLNSLNERVEQLEKAFVSDKLRRKKKKKKRHTV